MKPAKAAARRGLFGIATIVAVGALCACGHVARVSGLSNGMTAQLDEARSTQALETAQPEEATRRYRAVLAKVIVYKSHADYQQELTSDLNEAANTGAYTAISKGLDFTADAPLAIPHLYDAAVQAETLAELGMARLALAKSDLAGAESWIERALALADKRSLSPLARARLDISCYRASGALYAKQGKLGMAKLAALNEALTEDYLDSKAAQEDQARDEETARGDQTAVERLDQFAENVNAERAREVAAVLLQALELVAASAQQARQIQGPSGVRQLAFREILLKKSFGIDQASITSYAYRLVDPMAGAAMGPQLISPDFGAKGPVLIKNFVAEIAQLSGSADMRESAKAVGDSLDLVVDSRKAGPKEIEKALEIFARAFGSFESRAETVAGGPSSPQTP